MNTSPRLRYHGFNGDPTHNPGCGFMAMDNVARAWWQSRAGLLDPPQLTDLHALARDIRVSALGEAYARDAMADSAPDLEERVSAKGGNGGFSATVPMPSPFDNPSIWDGVIRWRLGDGPWHEMIEDQTHRHG